LVQNAEETVSKDILEMLGKDPQKLKALDIVLHDSLKLHWNYWVTHGIEKKSKEELMEKYARLTEFDAPRLNPEISAILSESAAKRDSFMVENQKLAGSALTAIDSALTMVMTEEDDIDKLLFVDRLNEAAKLIMAIHYNESLEKHLSTQELINSLKLFLKIESQILFYLEKIYRRRLKNLKILRN